MSCQWNCVNLIFIYFVCYKYHALKIKLLYVNNFVYPAINFINKNKVIPYGNWSLLVLFNKNFLIIVACQIVNFPSQIRITICVFNSFLPNPCFGHHECVLCSFAFPLCIINLAKIWIKSVWKTVNHIFSWYSVHVYATERCQISIISAWNELTTKVFSFLSIGIFFNALMKIYLGHFILHVSILCTSHVS